MSNDKIIILCLLAASLGLTLFELFSQGDARRHPMSYALLLVIVALLFWNTR